MVRTGRWWDFTDDLAHRVRDLLDAAPAETAPGPFDAFNLSDIFEYMSDGDHERVYAGLVGHARPGARLVYWNMLAPRGPAPDVADRVEPLGELAAGLHARDRAWFYQRLHVDRVIA